MMVAVYTVMRCELAGGLSEVHLARMRLEIAV
jgi:hypothetical protein